ncbi:transforming growth factor-beta-induced protein ig-h3 [Lingula anatina]|uniref:Transforming growth factor-beta-induced protein ig-h3 n=1 Tax=Lingula anatina TaxID=7574 RepID=A0A1S3K2E8_LINAN|nr:transforming growth factor-beta-induced protein ig-h3 [Lingula anatina]|eukprot:XP_013416813.1 transforming growth factor-beta-induced protein ig-h3 [Lingula anatina]
MKVVALLSVLLLVECAAASPLLQFLETATQEQSLDVSKDPVEEFFNLPAAPDNDEGDDGSPNMMLTFGVKGFEEEAVAEEEAPLDCGLDLFQLAWKIGAKQFCLLVWRAGLKDTLKTGGPFTVFVPSDRAISRLPAWVKFYLIIHKTALQAILKYHVINGRVMASELMGDDEKTIPTLYKDKSLRINVYPRKHPKGSKLITASGSPVWKADINATNGVIHLVGKVITSIPVDTSGGVVEKCPDFRVLKRCLNATGLTGALKGDGPLTLFAPTNEAFRKLPPGVRKMLLNNSTVLKEVLLYHVVNLTYYAAGLVNYDNVTTFEGDAIKVHACRRYHVLKVNNARVTYPDVSTTNGVMHAINRVLLPPSMADLLSSEPDVEEEGKGVESNEIPMVYEKIFHEKFDFEKEMGRGFNEIRL